MRLKKDFWVRFRTWKFAAIFSSSLALILLLLPIWTNREDKRQVRPIPTRELLLLEVTNQEFLSSESFCVTIYNGSSYVITSIVVEHSETPRPHSLFSLDDIKDEATKIITIEDPIVIEKPLWIKQRKYKMRVGYRHGYGNCYPMTAKTFTGYTGLKNSKNVLLVERIVEAYGYPE